MWRRGDGLALAVALALIAVAAVVGYEMNRRGLPIVLPRPPLLAFWHPQVGWGTPLAILSAPPGFAVATCGRGAALARLLLAGWLLNLAWMCSLTLVDGLQRGWIDVLLDPNSTCTMFTGSPTRGPSCRASPISSRLVPGVDGDLVWTTHVAGHPPLTTLIFWLLARIGLGGGFWAGALFILVGSTASVALPATLRELGAEAAAGGSYPSSRSSQVRSGWLCRRMVCLPAWLSVAWHSCAWAPPGPDSCQLDRRSASRDRRVLVVRTGTLWARRASRHDPDCRQRGLRKVLVPWLIATGGFVAVAAIHLALGFNWVSGLVAYEIRYYQGIASQRPFSYFVYADLAAWLVSCSPLLAIGVVRSMAVLSQGRAGPWTQDRTVALLALSVSLRR